MIRYNFHGMNFVALLHANIFEDQLAIFFYLPIIEYSVSILGHQHDVVGDLTIAMAETAQFQLLSHPSHRWVAPPVAKAPSTTSLQKEATFYQFKRAQRMGEGSLHPRPEGRGIRDPPRSQCNKKLIYPLVTEQTISRNWFPPTAHFICHLFAPSGIKNMCLAFPAFMLLAE